MWPRAVDWKRLRFGVEIEFIGGQPEAVELLPGWIMSLDERQIDETGAESGSELKPPPIRWEDREQIRTMLGRLKGQGASANWSCGLHVHVGLEPWGQDIVLPLLDAALTAQEAIRSLLQMTEHRLMYCPPVTPEMRECYIAEPGADVLRHRGRPQSHRCGINAAAWFDIGTVEIRYANGTLDYGEMLNVIELCLRFVAAIGEGRSLPQAPAELAAAIGAPAAGYPASASAPRWYQERIWLENALLPFLVPLAAACVPEGELHHILPEPDGLMAAVEGDDGKLIRHKVQLPTTGWTLIRHIQA